MKEKLIFYYGSMEGGKTTRIFQMLYVLEKNNQQVLVIKSAKDTKGEDSIVNRQQERRKVDILLQPGETLLSGKNLEKIFNCTYIIVDEAQFLDSKQVEEIWQINKRMNIGVTCFGLRSNSKTDYFEGTARLFAMADEVKKIETNALCACGSEAVFNARLVDGEFTMEGEDIAIDGENSRVKYVPLCGECFHKKVYIRRRKNK